jgi:DNA-directed RNA polymerase subunit RPC12/RpoP
VVAAFFPRALVQRRGGEGENMRFKCDKCGTEFEAKIYVECPKCGEHMKVHLVNTSQHARAKAREKQEKQVA